MKGTDDGKNERTITDRLSVAPLGKGMGIMYYVKHKYARTSSLGFVFDISLDTDGRSTVCTSSPTSVTFFQ